MTLLENPMKNQYEGKTISFCFLFGAHTNQKTAAMEAAEAKEGGETFRVNVKTLDGKVHSIEATAQVWLSFSL